MYFFRKAGAKVLLFFELTKYFPRKMHFFAAFYSFLFILLHFSMISDRFRVKVRVEGGEGAKEAKPVSGAEERTHIIIFARRRATRAAVI